MIEFYTNVTLRKNKIYLRGYENGERFQGVNVDYRPYLFFKSQQLTPYRTIHGETVEKHEYKNIKSAQDAVTQYKEVSNVKYYGLTQWVYPFLNDRYPGQVQFDANWISVVSLDIEVAKDKGRFATVEEANGEVTAITMVRRGKSITLGTKDYKPQNDNQTYVKCIDELDLLQQFLQFWGNPKSWWSPDVVTGWSSDLYDIPYLVNRIRRLLGDEALKKLSPFGLMPEAREIIRAKGSAANFDQRKDQVYDIPGIAQLDYLQLYKKFTFTNHPSYSLNNIAIAELGDSKVDYGEYGSIDGMYEKNPQLFFEYNIKDSLLVERLDNKLNFIQQVISIAYRAKVNYIDAMTTLRPWEVIIHNYLLERNIVISPQSHKEERPILGGYVKPPIVGLHHWVVSFDFDSLYPSIIQQHNISPETMIDKVHSSSPEHIVEYDNFPKHGDDVVCCNGTVYCRDKEGFIPAVIDLFVKERSGVKKQMLELSREDKVKNEDAIKRLDNYQKALKILSNGLYGALSNPYFRWYDPDLAESVTTTAQVCTRYVEKHLNIYFNKLLQSEKVDYIIAADTDSVYINLERLVVASGMAGKPTERVIEFLDRSCIKIIQPLIERYCTSLCEAFRVYTKKLHMKRESLIDKAIWRSGSKMYVLNVWDSEGVRFKEPEIKIKGMEAVRSSTPMVCRDKIKEGIKIVINKDERALQEFIADFKEKFLQMKFEDIASPRTCNGLSLYYDPKLLFKKKTPVHVRAAIVYNEVLKELELTHQYPLIKDRDKIKWIYLRKDNPFRSEVIAGLDDIPKEFEIENYIDKEKQFEKVFLSPLEKLAEAIGWKAVAVSDLMAFM